MLTQPGQKVGFNLVGPLAVDLAGCILAGFNHFEAELIFTALAELSTRQIAESMEATGLGENEAAAKTGGGIAKKARLELEGKTGKKVVSAENYLPPSQKKIK